MNSLSLVTHWSPGCKFNDTWGRGLREGTDCGLAYRRVGSIRKAGRPISLDGAQHGESQVRVRYVLLIWGWQGPSHFIESLVGEMIK